MWDSVQAVFEQGQQFVAFNVNVEEKLKISFVRILKKLGGEGGTQQIKPKKVET